MFPNRFPSSVPNSASKADKVRCHPSLDDGKNVLRKQIKKKSKKSGKKKVKREKDTT
jgi:hypothetical protein